MRYRPGADNTKDDETGPGAESVSSGIDSWIVSEKGTDDADGGVNVGTVVKKDGDSGTANGQNY
jgi:hypothetical protein